MTHPIVANLLTRYPTPTKLAAAGRGHVRARLRKHAPRLAESLTEEVFTALGQQTVVVAGTEAAATVMPILAGHLASYAGIAPVTRRSETPIRGEQAAKGGN